MWAALLSDQLANDLFGAEHEHAQAEKLAIVNTQIAAEFFAIALRAVPNHTPSRLPLHTSYYSHD
jgi:hypothetical protein